MIKDYYFRAPSLEVLNQLLLQSGLATESEERLIYPDNLDLIDQVERPTGIILIDENGNEYQEMKILEGYHANLRTREPLTSEQLFILEDILIDEPNNPKRVYA